MPYKSAAQSRFLHSQHPEIAAKWDKEQKASGKPFPKGAAHVTHHSPSKVEHMEIKEKGGSQAIQKGSPVREKGVSEPGGKAKEGEDAAFRGEEFPGMGSKKDMKPENQPSPEDGEDMALAKRGMSSGEGAKWWKTTGMKVPSSSTENHTGKK